MIDPEYLTKHYAGLSDEALMAVDRDELVELARAFYDQEIERRGLLESELPGVSTGPGGPVSLRLRQVKRAALVACIATVIGAAIPMWTSIRQMLALESNIGSNIGRLGAIAAILVGYIFAAIVPLFYFALYLNDGDLLVSRNMRRVTITAAAVIGLLGVAAIPGWIGSFRGESAGRPWTIGDTSAALGEIATLASILPLVALFRLATDGSSERGVSVSRLLRMVTKVAVIAGGIVAVGCVIGVMATPWVYAYLRDRSLEMGYSNVRWTFSRLVFDRVQTALAVVCLYVAPFVVWRGSRIPRD